MNLSKHCESKVNLNVPPETAFAFLDDPRKLASHMEKSSWKMAGSHMFIELDSREGKSVGSKIVMKGKMMGVSLYVNEDVVERAPPLRKVWETRGPQRLVVIDQYKMGFELYPSGPHTQLKVFIDYSIPTTGFKRVLGRIFGKAYARWCTETMAKDAARHFQEQKETMTNANQKKHSHWIWHHVPYVLIGTVALYLISEPGRHHSAPFILYLVFLPIPLFLCYSKLDRRK